MAGNFHQVCLSANRMMAMMMMMVQVGTQYHQLDKKAIKSDLNVAKCFHAL